MLGTRRTAIGLALGLAVTGASAFGQTQNPADAVGAVPGQGPGMFGTGRAQGGMNLIMVLMAPAVQEELKLSAEQKNQVFELAREASRRSREVFQSALQAGGGNPQALMAAGQRLRQENERAAGQILKPEQKKRATQIMLRVEGPLAVARPEVAARLNLSQAQSRQVQFTLLQLMQAQRAMAQSGPGGPDAGEPGAGPDRLRAAAGQQIGRILDAKQKAAFNTMLGEPFDLSKIDPALGRPSAAAGDANAPASPKAAKSSRPRRKRATGAAKGAAGKAEKDEDQPKS